MKPLFRQVIYPKDIEIYTGKSRFTAYRILTDAKKQLNKSADDLITIREFCQVTKFDEEVMTNIIKARS